MTAQELPELAARIESALRATPGVRSIYRSGSLVSNLIGRGAAALGLIGDGEPLVAVAWEGGRAGVEASIAVDSTICAADTVRVAQTAIEALFAEVDVEASVIRLTVVHVQEA